MLFRRFNVPAWLAADGSGKDGLLPGGSANDYPSSAGPDADSALVVRVQPNTGGDIYLMSITGRFEPRKLVATRSYEGGPQLSPDGQWLLYQSNESGAAEITCADIRNSIARGRCRPAAAHSHAGIPPRTRSAIAAGKRWWRSPFDGRGAEPVIGKPVALFADEYDFGQGVSIANYDITRDGRFIMLRRNARSGTVRAVIHWTDELTRILAAGGVR